MTTRTIVPATYALAAATVATGAANHAVTGLVPALVDGLHLPLAVVGQLNTAFGLASGIAAPIIGVLTAHWSRRRVLLAGLLLTVAGNAVAAVAPSFVFLIAARILAGLGSAAAMAAALGQAAELNAPGHRARAMAVVIGGLTFALATAPPLAALTAAHHGPALVFAALTAVAVAALAVARTVLPEQAPDAAPVPFAGRLRAVALPGIRPILTAKFLISAAAFAVQTYLTALISTYSPAQMLAAYGAGAVLGTHLGGRAADRHGPRATATAAIAAQVATFAVWPLLGPTPVAIALPFAAGVAFWAAQPAYVRQLTDTARDQAPAVLSIDSSVIFAGMAAGGLIGAIQPAHAFAVWLPVSCSILSAAALGGGVFSGKNPFRACVSWPFTRVVSDTNSAWPDPRQGVPTRSTRQSPRKRSRRSKTPAPISGSR
ncbi:MFS transporter [Amycolatopsis roodepoortensis]|uniref:MFS family arabinose efflux permease n=1 Tax=Amycolatopsis roodepoortensis TaxID=700274 RepID=A0ABR9LIL1_9PSEU|nr:MFS transporter [Amycolatopsis roodepoortensis]MBE1580531.1 putative MFS family arabinose efflux permease [Amycolatopsis roodepoortensis]